MGSTKATRWRRAAHVVVGVACSAVGCSSTGDPVVDVSLPPVLGSVEAPALAKREAHPEPVARWAPRAPTWVHPLPIDHGVRSDRGGEGQFLAPRFHGKHNGVDLLAPVGTDVFAACDGKAKADVRGGYGNVVQVVCALPKGLGGEDGLHASLFYAHLDKTVIGKAWKPIKAGQKVGTVGKSGNASGEKIRPHLHLEMIVRATEKEAQAENHAGLNDKASKQADPFFERLADTCMSPAHLSTKVAVRRERRVDPFVLLTCAGKPKPSFSLPGPKHLREAARKWSRFYESRAFDVDEGPRTTEVAKVPAGDAK